MMMSRRTERLNHLLREELSRLIRTAIKDPRVGSTTVTEVVTSPDLSHATVYIRTLDPETPPEEALRGLESASGFIRGELGRALRIRRVPEFHFAVDQTLEKAQRIERLLRQVRDEDGERNAE